RRRHTRFSRDWSSDVCSSDLAQAALAEQLAQRRRPRRPCVPFRARQRLRSLLAGHNPPRAPHGSEPDPWERVYYAYWFFADRWGGTPEQGDRPRAVILHRLREVALTVEEWQREQADHG